MKRIKLTQGQYAIIDDEDYSWLIGWNWCALKSRHTFYANAYTEHGQQITMHRLLMCHPYRLMVDHEDHNGLNNQKNNLRVVTPRGNNANLRSPGSSVYTGVSWSVFYKKWKASISIGNYNHTLGCFDLEVEASEAYKNALKKFNLT